MRKLILTSFLGLSLFGLNGQDYHPIEEKERAKLKDAVTTADMVEPQDEAYQQWDHLLNIVYQEIKAEVNPNYFKIIRNSQRAWITYRDARIQEINYFYFREMQGTMWWAPAAGERVKLVQDRVMNLLQTYEMNTELFEREEWGIREKWVAESGLEAGTELNIRDDFTLVWKYPNQEETQFQFYTRRPCAEDEKSEFITFVEPAKPEESQCYQVAEINRDRLVLTNVQSGKQLSFRRDR